MEQLIAGMRGWVLDKTRPLGEILLEQGVLSSNKHARLAAIAENHLLKYGKGEQAILSIIGGQVSVLDELRTIADPNARHVSTDWRPSARTTAGRVAPADISD